MFERFSERARRAIFYARYEALHRGASEITTSDLALGITREADKADCVLSTLQIDTGRLRELLLAKSKIGEPFSVKDIPLTTTSKLALAYAAEEANQDSSHPIDVQHLLRGVIRTNDKVSAILAQIGCTMSSVRIASGQSASARPMRWKSLGLRFKLRRQRIFLLVFFILLAMMFLIVGLRE